MKILYMLLILLLAVTVSAADLDSTRKARAVAYKLLQLDTTGTTSLPTADMDQYINIGMNKVNEDLCSYRRHTFDATADGQRLYGIDSCIQIIKSFMVTNDSIWGLRFVDLDDADEMVFDVASFVNSDWPTHYYFIGDSIGLFPSPIRDDDTLWTFYNHTIPKDSMRLLPLMHRFGVVLYAAYLGAMDVEKDPTMLKAEYDRFITTRKPRTVEGK